MVLQRLAESEHRPALVVTRPDAKRGRGQKAGAAAGRRPSASARHRASSSLPTSTPPDVLERHRRGGARGARGVRLRGADQGAAALGLRDPQRPPVAAAALARGGAGRAGDHGRRRGDGRRDHAAHRGPRLRAGVPGGARADRAPTTTTARSPLRLAAIGGEALVRALDERPPYVEQDEARRHLRAQDRGGRPRARPDAAARGGRAGGARAAAAHRRAAAAPRRVVPGRGPRRGRRRDAGAGRRPRAHRRRAAAARLQRRRARADRDPAAGRAGDARRPTGCAGGPTRR